MTYNISDDFIAHGYKREIADKVDYLLNGIINVPGVFDFGDEKEVKMNFDGFIEINGEVEIQKDDGVIVDFLMNNNNHQRSHYHYEDGKIRYVVSNNSGLYIIKGYDSRTVYDVDYFDDKSKSYLMNKYELDEDNLVLLSKPKKTFKKEGISPDYSYSLPLDPDNMSDTVSSIIFSDTWINDCGIYMEGESYEPNHTPSRSKKLEKKRKKNKH